MCHLFFSSFFFFFSSFFFFFVLSAPSVRSFEPVLLPDWCCGQRLTTFAFEILGPYGVSCLFQNLTCYSKWYFLFVLTSCTVHHIDLIFCASRCCSRVLAYQLVPLVFVTPVFFRSLACVPHTRDASLLLVLSHCPIAAVGDLHNTIFDQQGHTSTLRLHSLLHYSTPEFCIVLEKVFVKIDQYWRLSLICATSCNHARQLTKPTLALAPQGTPDAERSTRCWACSCCYICVHILECIESVSQHGLVAGHLSPSAAVLLLGSCLNHLS